LTLQLFQNLKYGNIIGIPGPSGSPGIQKMVLHTNRDIDGRVTHVGIIDALDPLGAEGYQLLSDASSETVLTGRTIPGNV
jgi:hypothetical protein